MLFYSLQSNKLLLNLFRCIDPFDRYRRLWSNNHFSLLLRLSHRGLVNLDLNLRDTKHAHGFFWQKLFTFSLLFYEFGLRFGFWNDWLVRSTCWWGLSKEARLLRGRLYKPSLESARWPLYFNGWFLGAEIIVFFLLHLQQICTFSQRKLVFYECLSLLNYKLSLNFIFNSVFCIFRNSNWSAFWMPR